MVNNMVKCMVDKYSKYHKIMGKDIYGKQMGMQFSQMAALHLEIFFSSYIYTCMHIVSIFTCIQPCSFFSSGRGSLGHNSLEKAINAW